MSMNPVAKLHLEMATYKMADTYMVGYTGGCWTFKRAGFYVPQVTGKVKPAEPVGSCGQAIDCWLLPRGVGLQPPLLGGEQFRERCYVSLLG